jgi:hypothetical protein
LLKQKLPKEVYETMSDEEKRETPILGEVTAWEHVEAEPVSDSTPLEEGSDLPF